MNKSARIFTMTTQLTFQTHTFDVINQSNQIWLTSKDLAAALQYASSKSVTDIYNKNTDEFTSGMSQVVESTTSRNYRKKTRIFSLRGAHLIAMFSRTEIAKEFRRWVLDILDRETGVTPALVPEESYSEIWHLMSKHFGVKHIRELAPAQVKEALSYLRELEGVFIGKEALPGAGLVIDLKGDDIRNLRFGDLFRGQWQLQINRIMGTLRQAISTGESIRVKNLGRADEELVALCDLVETLGGEIEHQYERLSLVKRSLKPTPTAKLYAQQQQKLPVMVDDF